jgi:DTW domain-containing protein YfiP
MAKEHCLCAMLPRLELETRVLLVVHTLELYKTTNTGVLATRCLTNSDVLVTGARDRPVAERLLADDERAYVLYPDAEARPLDELSRESPITLIVPDGNWRQARKQCVRVSALRDLPRVRLPDGIETRYRLRTSTTNSRLATMEAIAHALTVLEGKDVGDALLAVFDEMVARTLRARGDTSSQTA